MRAIGWPRRNPLETAWAVFAAANLVAMAAWPSWETIPFHFVWVSTAVVYGLRRPDPLPQVFGFHEVFHLCTLIAAVCHYIAIWLAVFR